MRLSYILLLAQLFYVVASTEVCNDDCFACGVAYFGSKLGDPIDPFTGTAEDCHALCVSTEGCKFFLYQKWNRARCVLKQGKGTAQPNSNSISGSAYKCRKPDELIVDGNGNADHTTIQECVDAAQPGQSCLVREGRYHEVVTITNKTDITIKGYEKERPIIDGTVVLKPRGIVQQWWQNHKGICAAKIQINVPHIFQLFYDDEMMTNARWPNAVWADKSVFNNTYWAKSDITSTRGTMVDNGSADLASSGLNMTGAMAVLNVGSYNTFSKQVLWHEPNSNNFTYEDDFGNIIWKPKNNQYYLDSKLELLDNPGEWFYDKETEKLYFIPPNGGSCPDRDAGKLRGRTVTHSMVVRKTTNLLLKNIDFFASNVEAVGLKKKEDEIDEINLDSINFFYPSSSKRMLQDNSVPQRTKLVAKMHGSISVINCTFIGAEGSALYYWSKKSKIYNNLFAWNDWSGHMGQKKNGGYGTVYSSPTSKDEEFIGNTLWYNGASAGYRSGKTPIISDNLVVGQGDGEIMHDGSGIQLQTECQIGSKILRNWVYDSPKYAIRFDHSTSDPNNLGYHGEMSNNVIWNTMGMMVKGNNHTVESNLALDNTDGFEAAGSLLVIHILRTENVVQNEFTNVKNNAATRADGGVNMQVPWPFPRWPLAGITENNYSGEDLNELLVDVDNKDFRPKSANAFTASGNTGSILGDSTGNLIGPYASANEGDITQYDIPGHKLDIASYPIPADGSTVKERDIVMFRPGFRCESNKVYVSSPDGDIPDIPTKTLSNNANGRPDNVVKMDVVNDGIYSWRVDCIEEDTGDIRKGDTWTFTVDSSL